MAESTPNSTLGEELKKEIKDKQTAEDIIKTVFNERDNYQQSNQTEREVLNEIYQAYVGELSDPKDRSKSQEKITKMRTETNYIVPSIFSGQPELEVEKVGEEDKDLAEVAQEIVNYRLNNIPQAYEKIEAWVKQSVVFGTSLMKVFWRFETEEKEEQGERGVMTKYGVVTKDEPDLQVPNIVDCFYNPIISDIENQNSIIFRAVLSIEEIKGNTAYDYTGEGGKLNREIIESKDTFTSSQYDSSRQVASDKIDLQKSAKGTVEVYERITKDRIQTVADGRQRLVLRDREHEYECIPAVKLTHEPSAIPDRFSGYGVGHNTIGTSRLIQKLANRLTDNVNLANTPAFMFKKGAGIEKKQLVIKAGGGIEVDAEGPLRDNIAQVEVADITSGGLALLNRFDDEHKRASGANDLIQGAASNNTLGQDQIASTYSSNRFELINRRFKQALADVGRLILKMEIQNIQSIDAPILKIFPLEAEVVGGKIRYSRETVYKMLIAARENGGMDFNIKIKGETNVSRNKDVLLKQFTEWYTIFGPILPPVNQIAAAKKWLELRGIDETDKLVPDPDEFAQEQAAQAPVPGMPQTGLNVASPIA